MSELLERVCSEQSPCAPLCCGQWRRLHAIARLSVDPAPFPAQTPERVCAGSFVCISAVLATLLALGFALGGGGLLSVAPATAAADFTRAAAVWAAGGGSAFANSSFAVSTSWGGAPLALLPCVLDYDPLFGVDARYELGPHPDAALDFAHEGVGFASPMVAFDEAATIRMTVNRAATGSMPASVSAASVKLFRIESSSCDMGGGGKGRRARADVSGSDYEDNRAQPRRLECPGSKYFKLSAVCLAVDALGAIVGGCSPSPARSNENSARSNVDCVIDFCLPDAPTTEVILQKTYGPSSSTTFANAVAVTVRSAEDPTVLYAGRLGHSIRARHVGVFFLAGGATAYLFVCAFICCCHRVIPGGAWSAEPYPASLGAKALRIAASAAAQAATDRAREGIYVKYLAQKQSKAYEAAKAAARSLAVRKQLEEADLKAGHDADAGQGGGPDDR